MLLNFLQARFNHIHVRAARGATAKVVAQSERDAMNHLEAKLRVYPLDLPEASEILGWASDLAMHETHPILPSTLAEVERLISQHSVLPVAPRGAASSCADLKQQHLHAEQYLTQDDWDALRDQTLSVSNKATAIIIFHLLLFFLFV